jgi:hypothetical protein
VSPIAINKSDLNIAWVKRWKNPSKTKPLEKLREMNPK